MNEPISQYLNKYIENPDPQYAIMLKGDWGCGKSFFIQNWIERYKSRLKKGEIELEPIYVSLYGLKEPAQITTAIDRILHPFLYSKGAQFGKKILKIAGCIALKTSWDIDSDDKEDISLDATIDSLSLLTSKDKETSIGPKLIIFDDIERCLIDMKQLLGYINNFVEHGECHVIIIGDETHVDGEDKKKLLEFKEKTVGREFEVKPDVSAAVEYFMDDMSVAEWLRQHKTFILDCFKQTKSKNLRILRQCLYDFNSLYNEIDSTLLKSGNSYMVTLLGSYIITYCEYRGDNHALIKKWLQNYFLAFVGDETTKKEIGGFQNKYNPLIDLFNIDVLNNSNIEQIIKEIETGCSLKGYVESALREIQKCDIAIQDKLAVFMELSNDEFNAAYKDLENDIITDKITSSYVMGRSLAILAFFDYKGLHKLSSKIILKAKQYISNKCKSVENKEVLQLERTAFLQGVQSYGRFNENPIGKDILEFANNLFYKMECKLKNKLEQALLCLSDDNIEDVIKLSVSSNYNTTSMLKNIDANILAGRILLLSNKNLQSFCDFLSCHYQFAYSLGSGFSYFKEDLPVLESVYRILTSKLSKKKYIDKYMLEMVLKYFEGAIKRANGESHNIEIS